MSFTFYPIVGTEPNVASGAQAFAYSKFHGKAFFATNTPSVGYIALYSINDSLVITQEASTTLTGYTGSGIVIDESNGDVYFLAKNNSNSTANLYKWSGSNLTSIATIPSASRPESLQLIGGFLHYLGANRGIYRLPTTGGTPTLLATAPLDAANSLLVSKVIREGAGGKYYLYGSKSVLESSDLINWAVTHVPNPYTGSQTTWFVTTGFEFNGRHVCLVRFDTSSSTKTAIYELKAGGVYEELCPPFGGDCQGWGVAEGYIFLTSGYTTSPNRSLFSVISKNGHVYINKPCSARFGISPTTPFVQIGNRMLWPHSTEFAVSDPIAWIDAMKVTGGWIMGG